MAVTKIRDEQAAQSVSLTAEVSGTLPVGNGGTGATTLTGIIEGNGTSAFTVAVAGTDYAGVGSTTQTLSGTRLNPRALSVSNTTSWTIDSDAYDYAQNTGLTGAVTLNNPTGTPVVGQKLWIVLVGTAARAISYGTAFEDGPVTRPTTTVTTQRMDIGFIWNSTSSKWRCVASGSAA